MRSPRLSVLGLVLGSALTAAVGGCEYDPHPVDGTLKCSSKNECPQGFTCQQSSGTCWSNGGPPSSDITKYVGEWLLSPTSNVLTSCDDGFKETTLLSPVEDPTTMTVSLSGSGLWTFWLCEVTLSWDASTGAHLNDPDPSCVDGTDPEYLWTATKFDLVTSNGLTAQHSATYTRRDTYLDGEIVNCNQTVTAPLIKQ